ncbi:NADH dehydrogenase [ubiquinone] 1 alpha subcomplex subunit 5-like [Varroa jacobsoni]|uniref:NADH dehydrogenase [ubiquinone] 1 alpha subcomplex subunit 5 n=1 Tax=Varroa destructor TaxID=109461 RepID=A0A7M7JCC7_VARDE|nr:NADH dehydrogenase [ubiquinone] 1 alpha subcomplex subunit 5-like [Varroa destructor]XP_022697121.1 NADH dehydrogenase [ubiquinone] 1 alpha subcomplex subunit 5-like [Varroa jacobsoni]
MAGVLKKTTGLTGLAVHKNPHHILGVLYKKILQALDQIPQDATYRRSTEPIIQEKLALVQSINEIAQLEDKLGYQAEECIQQAENELVLARQFQTWKPWLPLETPAPPDQWKWPI